MTSSKEIQDQLLELRRQKDEQERQLMELLHAAQDEERRLKEEAELKKELKIEVVQLMNAFVEIHNPYRQDFIDLLRRTKGRQWKGDTKNLIPIAEWAAFILEAQALPNVVIEYRNERVEKLIHDWLYAPNWEIELLQRWIKCSPGPHAHRNAVYGVQGAEWKIEGEYWLVPLSEAWGLAEKMKDVENVVWSEEAQALVEEQIKRRSALDNIALQERDPVYGALDLNGLSLRDFQTVGSAFMEATDGRCIDGDEMGLGKSPQAIAYAHRNNFRTLVICPAFLKPNWQVQINKFTGKRAVVLSGQVPSLMDMGRMLYTPSEWTIINYDIAGSKIDLEDNKTRFLWIDLINQAKFDLIIIDEGHYIKNTDSNRSKAVRQLTAPRLVFLSGTPVMNRANELWPMLTMIDHASFPAQETFERQWTYDGKRVKNPAEFKKMLKRYMIRRTKAELPEYQGITLDRMTELHELSPKAQKLYDKVEAGIYERIAEYDAKGRGGDKTGIPNVLVQIQRLKQVCAIDKAERTADLARELYEQTEGNYRKVLIFSQFKAIAYRITQLLGDDGAIGFVRRGESDFITVDINERYRLVRQFQEDPDVKYLIVTEKSAREGLDITAAGHVIFNDQFWTPAGHEQCEGRAYGRMSDMHGIDSRYIVTDMGGNSIDEWIMKLLAMKTGIIKQTVEGLKEVRSSDESIVGALIQMFREAQWTRKK